MKHRLLMEHSGVDTRLAVFCLAREHSVFVSTPSMKHVTLCYRVAGRDYFVRNQSAFSKLLTSYRASEWVTELHHPNNSFLCFAYPRVKKENAKLIRQFQSSKTVMAYGVAGSTRLIEPEWKFLLNTVTYCFDFQLSFQRREIQNNLFSWFFII